MKWRLGCGDDAYRMQSGWKNWKRVSGVLCYRIIRGSIQEGCNTSNDVRCRYTGSEESTKEEVGCGGNEGVKMDDWSNKLGRIRNERIRGTTKVGEISKKVLCRKIY